MDISLQVILMVFRYRSLLLATVTVHRSTFWVPTGTTGRHRSARQPTLTSCTSIREVSAHSTTSTGSTVSLFGLFSNFASNPFHHIMPHTATHKVAWHGWEMEQ